MLFHPRSICLQLQFIGTQLFQRVPHSHDHDSLAFPKEPNILPFHKNDVTFLTSRPVVRKRAVLFYKFLFLDAWIRYPEAKTGII